VDDASAQRRLYGVKDPCYTASGLNSACTTTVSEGSLGAAFTSSDTNTDGSTDAFGNINADGSSDVDGWYIPLQQAFGSNGAERVITDPLATTIGVVFFTTAKPSTDICTFGGKRFGEGFRKEGVACPKENVPPPPDFEVYLYPYRGPY